MEEALRPTSTTLSGKIFEQFYLIGPDEQGAPTTLFAYPRDVSTIIA